jgi:hypothetical protein
VVEPVPAPVAPGAATPVPIAPGAVVPGPIAPGPIVSGPVAPAAAVVVADPYHAATPYNPTVVARMAPNPMYNRHSFTLPCDIPNQDLTPYVVPDRGWGQGHFLRYSGGNGGCNDGCGGAGNGWLKGKLAGCCAGGGACATCEATGEFIFGSSRTFFGESSREFFERPPAVDGIPHPHKAAKMTTGTPIIP